MTTTPPPASHVDDEPAFRTPEVEACLYQLTEAQADFVRVVSDAGGWLDGEAIELAELAAHQTRLTQQLFDAQRSILRRRADAEVQANHIARTTERDARTLMDAALADASAMCADLDEITAFGDVLAMSRHERAVAPPVPIEDVLPDTEADTAERQLQALLDEWWRLEVEHGKATIDDANARAAVSLHLAQIEAAEIREAASAVTSAARVGEVAAEPEQH